MNYNPAPPVRTPVPVRSFEKITQSLVDGKMFYTIRCYKDISRWIREQPGEDADWYQHIDSNWHIDYNMFDVSEEFYIMLKLRWGHEQIGN